MNLNERITAFVKLGNTLHTFAEKDFEPILTKVKSENPWFTESHGRLALKGILNFLEPNALQKWTAEYTFREGDPKRVGVAMAGNIPAVGFHDFLSVLLSGNHLAAKLSSGDSILIPWLANLLIAREPRFASKISFEERLNKVDALIATGSDNTARYFEYYFRHVPHIIRKNRSSCAILLGEESAVELFELGKDVFDYFGLGCRNVSKLFIPEGFDLKFMLDQWAPYHDIVHHNKYCNNYEYQKSILLVNQQPFLDTGYLLLTENKALVSPIAIVYYEQYSSLDDLAKKLEAQQDKIQCKIAARGWYRGSIPFGKAQLPDVWDYADAVDTLKFLEFRN